MCATKAIIFRWNPVLPVNLYLDASNFAARYYITQVQDKETKPLIYNLFTLLLAERNYNIYQYKLVAIVKFIKKSFHMLNAK